MRCKRGWRSSLLGIVLVIFIQVILYCFIASLNQSTSEEEYEALQRLALRSHLLSTPQPLTSNENCSSKAVIQDSLEVLLNQTSKSNKWEWIVQRVSSLWNHWIQAAKSSTMLPGHKLRVLVVPGLFIATDFADKSRISSGGPLGDLVQWSDLIGALTVLGHNVTLEWDVYQAVRGLKYDKFLWSPKEGCPETGFDVIFTDIVAVKTFPPDVLKEHRLRILDAYGTEAMYNHERYALKNGYNSPYYGKLGLDLRQFYTFYPHTPDNSFLGFVVPPKVPNLELKLNPKMVLLYGKSAKYFEGKADFISHLLKLGLEVHATVDNGTHVLPPGVIDHGVLPSRDYRELMAKAKYFIGLGEPLESTAAVEALANGCIFINPRFSGNLSNILQHMDKPTSRKLESQVPYLSEHVGNPYVFTIDISNPDEVTETIMKTRNLEPKEFIPGAFTVPAFLQRLSAYLQHQDLCNSSSPPWPPVSAMTAVYGQPNASCSQACSSQGLVCEYSFFKLINIGTKFQEIGIHCPSTTQSKAGLLYPAHLVFRDICITQSDPMLFSCSGKHPDIRRLCPCRDFLKDQPSLCRDCL